MNHSKRLLAAALTVWIVVTATGCATVTPPAPATSTMSWESRQTLVARLQSWQISGKISVITDKDSGSASVDWSQHAQNFSISLYGPLGANSITMHGGPGGVTVKTSDGKTASAPTAEELLTQQWGWKLPLSYLKFWIRGLPVPGLPQNSTFDAAHRLTSLTQQGYTVLYQGYTKAGEMELPQRLSISSPAFRSKIFINKWNIS